MLDKILVEYDHNEKVHILNINFKIPVLVQREHSDITNDRVSLKPCKSAKKSINQIKPFRDYSTVTSYLSTVSQVNQFKGYSLRLSIQIKSSNLWIPPYSPYQQTLFDIISEFHEKLGLNFSQVSDWLNNEGYTTPRGKVFTQSHVWSIYTKKNRSIKRFTRTFYPIIQDINIDIVDIIPSS